MDCESIRREGIADEYRAQRLAPQVAEEYERHFFACDRCFEDLRVRDEVAAVLRTEGRVLFALEIAASAPARARRHSDLLSLIGLRRGWPAHPQRAWLVGLAVAAVLFAIGVFTLRTSSHTARLAALCTPVAYPYVPSELRGGAGSAEFRLGMEHYAEGRYGEARRLLERSARAVPQDPEILFYLGVSLLMSGYNKEASRALESAARLAPSSALYRWYLAQALLRGRRVDAATSQLKGLVSTGGDYATEAGDLLRRIDETRRR